MATITLSVQGMSCDGCEEIVEDALEEVSGVEEAEADHEADTASVEGDANPDDLVEAVDFAGYEASTDASEE
ncbi:MAG: heavy-metal-associated domain-containing protein [Halobacteriaceae archaeon]